MAKIKLKKIVTYDKNAGPIETKMERFTVSAGIFMIRFTDRALQTVEKELDTVKRRYAKALNVKELTPRQEAIAMAANAVVDWKEVLDENDKPVKYDEALLFEMLEDEDNFWMVEKIIVTTIDGTLYQTLEDVEKN